VTQTLQFGCLQPEYDEQKLEEHWDKLIRLNDVRKKMVTAQVRQAEEFIHTNNLYEQKVITVIGSFTDGLVGILAARIAERYKKPAIVLTESGKGSARSVNGSTFSIAKTIERCAEHLVSYGGHQAAEGLTVSMDCYPQFCSDIQKYAALGPAINVQHVYEMEYSLFDFPADLNQDLLSLEPFGEGNPLPLFLSKKMFFNDITLFGMDEEHVKFHFGSKNALLFFKGREIKGHSNHTGLNLQCLYSPSLNSYHDFIISDYFIEY
jgi:single-stranded-DNA-specific exonuclease